MPFLSNVRVLSLLLAVLASAEIGCSSLRQRARWVPPVLASPLPTAAVSAGHLNRRTAFYGGSHAALAEGAYAQAETARQRDREESVDLYFQAACYAWADLEYQWQLAGSEEPRMAELYRSSLISLVDLGQKHRRFDPQHGLKIRTASGWMLLPLNFHGFDWHPESLQRLIPVGDYRAHDLNERYRTGGIGVPMVVLRAPHSPDPFMRKQQRYAGTLVLRREVTATPNAPLVLELYEPLRLRTTEIAGKTVPLARDTSAPIAHTLSTTQRDYMQLFLHADAGSPDDAGLFMMAPYQRGKIPVVFVHGLLSDRFTWANIANEIFARPEIIDHYQVWSFQYPTGEPFLKSAAMLRRQLEEVRQQYDPHGTDPALHRIVLVGHSMGGLICKLQISYSGDALWKAVSRRPLEQINATPAERAKLAEWFFFDPSPGVAQAVFVGTPHRGSVWAQRPIGRLGASLVEEPQQMQARHMQLVNANPGTFSDEFSDRVPTSIDLLEPSSPLLQAMEKLPLQNGVKLHSIIGRGRWMLGSGDSDGIVPVSSAHWPGASEMFVAKPHAQIHQDREALRRMLDILAEHANGS